MDIRLTHKLQRGWQRRGVAEIITTMLLVAMTVIGAVLVVSFFSDSGGGAGIGAVVTSIENPRQSIKLTGFDTRDGVDLSGISDIDNTKNSPNPTLTKGSEFIVLSIRNIALEPTFLAGVLVNNLVHTHDTSPTGIVPAAGKFTLVNTTNPSPGLRTSTEIGAGQDLRVVVKLSSSLTDNIPINKAIKIVFDHGSTDVKEFVITSGTTR